MARPQNYSRGLFAKKRVRVPVSGDVMFDDYSTTNALLSAAASGLKVYGGLALSNLTNYITQNSTGTVLPSQVGIAAGARYINANTTGYVLTAEAALPTTDNGVAFTAISNSTGVCLAVNSTGTTWKYLNVTTVQPT